MRKITAFLLAIATTFAVLTSTAANNHELEIDQDAFVAFWLLLLQSRTDQLSRTFQPFISFMDNHTLSYNDGIALLSLGGIERELGDVILTRLMPQLRQSGKSTEETIIILLFISKMMCSIGNEYSIECDTNTDILLPLILMETEHGCNGPAMSSLGDMSAPGEMCKCHDQGNSMFWINMVEEFIYKSKRENSTRPNQFPLIVAMVLNETTCTGSLKIGKSDCSCSSLNKGNNPLYIQYLFNYEENNKTEEQRAAIRNRIGAPKNRQFLDELDTNDYLISLLGQDLDPPVLSLLLNQNEGNTDEERLRQLILSSIGLDIGLLQVVLNGGFGDGPDRFNFINYLTQLDIIDPSLIPLLLQVEFGDDFYLTNLIDQGQLDFTTAVLLLSREGGLSSSETLELLIEGISKSQSNPDYLSSLGRPYIPPLPEGIYPGSELFFAHFETLGVNTCALHDLRNRFDCGYIGITAAECETLPYCCFSPIFITDTEVRRSTNNTILSATSVPWCYYNVFFIYFESFYLPIKRPGEFAAPIQCKSLYKYGLELDPSFAVLLNSNAAFQSLLSQREECGFPGITEFQCVAVRGCCFDADAPFRFSQCYQPNGPSNIAFDYTRFPRAYLPPDGACNVNTFRIPVLYYMRVACHYTVEFHKIGYNLLSYPSRLDCLTKLGCCWEDDETVLETYPFTPQCYKRVGGVRIPSIIPSDVNDLIQRSGPADRPVIDPVKFPPNTPPANV